MLVCGFQCPPKLLLCPAGQVNGVPGLELAGRSVCALLRHPMAFASAAECTGMGEAVSAEKVGFGLGRQGLNLYLMETEHFG